MSGDRNDRLGNATSMLEGIAQESANDPVKLVEDEDTGHRFLLYATEAGMRVEFRYEGDALWMTQAQIVELFGRDQSVISRHIANIFSEGELDETSNMQKMHNAHSAKPVTIYSLDTVISVGYRVSSKQATLFRRWATETLVRFATKGFVVDTVRLRETDAGGKIDELREIIRDIRASEANVYREVRRIYSLCSDYDGSSKTARAYFARLQNRLLWATAGATAPEIITERADATKPDMGLTNWPRPNIRKEDVTIAHNYLGNVEIRDKNRFTVMLLDFFESRLEQGKLTTMAEADAEAERFILFNEKPLLRDKGSVSRPDADAHAKREYTKFNEARRAERLANPDPGAIE